MIELTDRNPARVKKFDEALAYLCQSSLAEAIIHTVTVCQPKISIVFDNKKNSRYSPGMSQFTIYWNPSEGLQTSRGVISPALALLHELGHAYQWLEGKMGMGDFQGLTEKRSKEIQALQQALQKEKDEEYKKKKGKEEAPKITLEEARQKYKEKGSDELEEINTTVVERTVANQLRQMKYPEGVRLFYTDHTGIVQQDRTSPQKGWFKRGQVCDLTPQDRSDIKRLPRRT